MGVDDYYCEEIIKIIKTMSFKGSVVDSTQNDI